MIEGLRSIARERAIQERDRRRYGNMHDNDKIIDAFLTVESGYPTSHDIYFESSDEDDDYEDKEIDELIDKIPESEDDDEEEISSIINGDEEVNIGDMIEIDEGCSKK